MLHGLFDGFNVESVGDCKISTHVAVCGGGGRGGFVTKWVQLLSKSMVFFMFERDSVVCKHQ